MMFDSFKKGTIAEGAELVTEIQNVTVRCKNCGAEEEIKESCFRCSECGSSEIEIEHEDRAIRILSVIKCKSCGKESESLSIKCPGCSSVNIDVLKGMDLILKSVEMEA